MKTCIRRCTAICFMYTKSLNSKPTGFHIRDNLICAQEINRSLYMQVITCKTGLRRRGWARSLNVMWLKYSDAGRPMSHAFSRSKLRIFHFHQSGVSNFGPYRGWIGSIKTLRTCWCKQLELKSWVCPPNRASLHTVLHIIIINVLCWWCGNG